MATITTSAAQQRSIEANLLTRKQRSLWQDAWWRLRRNRAAMLGLGIIALTAFLAIFAPMIAPYDPTAQDTKANNMDPFWVSSIYHNSKYLLGSDELGRDILSRLIWSTRISLICTASLGGPSGLPVVVPAAAIRSSRSSPLVTVPKTE